MPIESKLHDYITWNDDGDFDIVVVKSCKETHLATPPTDALFW